MVAPKTKGASMDAQINEPELSTDPTGEGEVYELGRRQVDNILYAVEIDDRDKLTDLMEPLHAADIADVLEQITPFDRARLIRLYDREFDGEILSELDEGLREEVIAVLTPQVLTQAVRDLSLIHI